MIGDVCMQIDVAQQDVSASNKVKQCKHKAPECERKWEKGLSRPLISIQCVCLNPALIQKLLYSTLYGVWEAFLKGANL